MWRLDRLGRSLKDIIVRAEALRTGGVGLKSLKEAIDTDSPTGNWSSTSSGHWPSSSGRSSASGPKQDCGLREREDD